MKDQLQIGCIKGGFVYAVQRVGVIDKETKTASVRLRLYKLPILGSGIPRGRNCYCELKDGEIVLNQGTFLRWRLSSSGMLCGTQRGLDDRRGGRFVLPLESLQMSEPPQSIPDNKDDLREENWGSCRGLQNVHEGDGLIAWCAGRYWSHRLGEGEVGLPPDADGPSSQRWPKKEKGSNGIYFDFLPREGDEPTSLFILLDKKYWFCSRRDNNNRIDTNMIELWANLDNERKRNRHPVLIATDLNEPFYVFGRKDDLFFVSISGKIVAAPRFQQRITAGQINKVIDELDSDTFETREKATQQLHIIGKPAQSILRDRLTKHPSLEQKRRITDLLVDPDSCPDRYTRVIWNDVSRPVNKVLFDLDKNKVYAFTRQTHGKRSYYFEIKDNPRCRPFAGSDNPDMLTSIPASVRTFWELARSVRAAKE